MSAEAYRRPVTLWVVYDHPRDYPHQYIARKWVGDQPGEVVCAYTVGALRSALERKGLHKLDRHASDDPIIVESWL